MRIFSISFLFLFLPVVITFYLAVPKRFRSFVLLVASLFYLASNSPLGAILFLINSAIDFIIAKFIRFEEDSMKRKVYVGFSTVKNVILVFIALAVWRFDLLNSAMPFTIFILSSFSYVTDVYNREWTEEDSFYDFTLYCSFFGKVFFGPIVSAKDMLPQIKDPIISYSAMGRGFIFLCHGFAKKTILSDGLICLYSEITSIPMYQSLPFDTALGLLSYILAAYFLISGYSDVARGLGAIFGYEMPANFHYPIQSESVTDFFSRFNISANRFIRKYVYSVLGSSFPAKSFDAVNIMLITILMSIWYGLNINLLVWGICLGFFSILEMYFFEKYFIRIPSAVRKLSTIIIITLSFVLFMTPNLSAAAAAYKSLFGIGSKGLISDTFMYLINENWVLLLGSILFSTDFCHKLGGNWKIHHKKLEPIITTLVNLGILVCSTAFML